ncbi:ArsR/SmtB family transcription factor [Xanthovirga aplysinae]|uniref:ArsR/SmtB family transcription factor n=1 Tax=Xanthovirga aplysinae TaxID=2529853 RepID=UPI0012BC3177|nr:metalloregulator ArsR/SmtB family transcription factor [Xanthovirga aplysinae]MTI31271.1 transcriptional regulator [Xanthovirga aplysinae]
MDRLEFQAEFCKCLSDQTRIRMFELLLKNKRMQVSAFQEELQIPQSKTSRHLIYMKNIRVMKAEQDGNAVFYFLNPEYLQLAKDIFRAFKKFEQKQLAK